MSLIDERRAAYQALVSGRDALFIRERPALFSPAAASQDAANLKGTLGFFGPLLIPAEFSDGWVEESSAHTRSCYLGDWTSLAKVIVRGPDAHAFLSWVGMNDLSDFAINQIKHHVQLDGNGAIASEGVICRLADDEYLYTAGSGDWLMWQFTQRDWSAEITEVSPDHFIFGVQGPKSIHVLEQVCGESLRDIEFNRSRSAQIGVAEVRVLRTGISGELGYEIHGDARHADGVWGSIAEAGTSFDMKLLGIRSQPVQHIEAGIATNGLDYMPAAAVTPGAPRQFRRGSITGSFVPTAFTDYFRGPGELGWGQRHGVAAHEFLGRDALIAAQARTQRKLVGLQWDPEAAARVVASLFGEGDPIEQMDLPRRQGPAFDQVLAGADPVGVSTGRTISVSLKSMISLCVIDPDFAAEGTKLSVLWGRPGTRQIQIDATVTSLPFKPDNRRIDVSTT